MHSTVGNVETWIGSLEGVWVIFSERERESELVYMYLVLMR